MALFNQSVPLVTVRSNVSLLTEQLWLKCKSTRKWKGKDVDETPLSDGYSQCRDMTDESASACSRYFDCFTNSVLEFNYFYSNLRTSGSIPSHLIPYLYVCDGIFDCANHSDETNCNYYWNINIMSLFCDSLFHSYFLLNTITFISYRYETWRFSCHLIPYLYVFDGIFDCANHSNETNCKVSWVCTLTLFHSYFFLNSITFIVIWWLQEEFQIKWFHINGITIVIVTIIEIKLLWIYPVT